MSKLLDIINQYASLNMSGKKVIVTGANSGIGYETSRVLSLTGATIIMACRNIWKGEAAMASIKESNPSARLELMRLDLSDLSSVRQFINQFRENFGSCDILVNNAGLMATPKSYTADGFEMQFGTNHIGHFVLTHGLIDGMKQNLGSRVVTITSIAHFKGDIYFDDLKAEKSYHRMKAYRQSKLANLLFAYELDRRLKEKGHKTISVAVHPGVTATNLVELPRILEILKDLVLMDTVKGALPTLMGAVSGELKGGEYIGPDGWKQAFGYPAVLKSGVKSYDTELAQKLWSVTEELTGLKFQL